MFKCMPLKDAFNSSRVLTYLGIMILEKHMQTNILEVESYQEYTPMREKRTKCGGLPRQPDDGIPFIE